MQRSPSPGKRPAGGEHFKLEVSEAKTILEEQQDAAEPHTPSKYASVGCLQPKARAPGGIWLTQSDFPYAFQHVIVYHNPKKYSHVEMHQDIWEHGAEPYVSNLSDVYIKLELDPEAAKKVLSEEKFYSRIGIKETSSKGEGQAEETKEEAADGTKSGATTARLLPGENEHVKPEHDDVLIGFAPYPSNKAAEVIPRYLTHLRQVDRANGQESDHFDHIFRSYFGAVQFHLSGELANQSCIWLKPEFNCPMGSTMWVAGQVRKVSFVPRAQYLKEQKGFHAKQVTTDYQPLQAGKYQLLGKYDFQITDDNTVVGVKVDAPADRFLLNYLRLKVLDKSHESPSGVDRTEAHKVMCLNQLDVADLKLKSNGGAGYCLLVEGVPPYNTTEGQLVIDTFSSTETFALQEVTHCEPVEYSDDYVPTKYGVIFREKVMISPVDHTSASLNIKLLKDGKEFGSVEGMKPKYFKLEILDNGVPIYSQHGYNQITVSHFMFRCNHNLPESAEGNAEVKHNYVVQALFDLHEWPNGKSANEESAHISWCIKL